ncbi:hypothetical protein ACKI1J_42690 [Streptomyces scabiei]|uniref:hypothetical protein n=1 Tax=Streptomyces scabiei TaxID=1930 RepID=UPI0038F5F3B7
MIEVSDSVMWIAIPVGAFLLFVAGFAEWRRVQREEQRQQQREEDQRGLVGSGLEDSERRARALATVTPVVVGEFKRERNFRALTGYWSEPRPTRTAVKEALHEVEAEFALACRQLGVDQGWLSPHIPAAKRISEITGNGRWLIVGANVAALWGAAERLNPTGFPHIPGVPDVVPTSDTAQAYVATAATVVQQIKTMRELCT